MFLTIKGSLSITCIVVYERLVRYGMKGFEPYEVLVSVHIHGVGVSEALVSCSSMLTLCNLFNLCQYRSIYFMCLAFGQSLLTCCHLFNLG